VNYSSIGRRYVRCAHTSLRTLNKLFLSGHTLLYSAGTLLLQHVFLRGEVNIALGCIDFGAVDLPWKGEESVPLTRLEFDTLICDHCLRTWRRMRYRVNA
jgi:hypothetical protein